MAGDQEVGKGRRVGGRYFFSLLYYFFQRRDKRRTSGWGSHPAPFLTSAVRPLVPAVAAVGVPVAQLADVDAHVGLQAAVLVDGTLVHPAV